MRDMMQDTAVKIVSWEAEEEESSAEIVSQAMQTHNLLADAARLEQNHQPSTAEAAAARILTLVRIFGFHNS